MRGKNALSWSAEWKSVRGLLSAQAKQPQKVREEDGYLLWETQLGPMWTPPAAEPYFIAMLMGEIHGAVYDLSLLKNAGAGAVFIDAGANIGVFSRFALAQGAGRVVSFEPSPATAECLRRNLAKEIASGQATVLEQGLWDSTTRLSFNTSNRENPGGHSIQEQGGGDVSVPVVSIDELWPSLGLDRLDFIKMDIEGSEVRALRGARETISRFRPQLCIATEHTDDLFANATEVIKAVSAFGNYEFRVTESHVTNSPSRGSIYTPYSLLFYPARG